MPAAMASSTAYWIRGLSTTGSISFGLALVAGRKRGPRPATGNTAVRITDFGIGLIKLLQRWVFEPSSVLTAKVTRIEQSTCRAKQVHISGLLHRALSPFENG